jgi:hypothetical protein
MTLQHCKEREGQAFTGGAFLIFGILLLLANLNFLDLRSVLVQWWPLILMAIGVKQLLTLRGPNAWIGGLFWIVAGGIFLARSMGIIHVAIGSIVWPLLLIWLGVILVVGCPGNSGPSSVDEGSRM